MYYVLCYYHHHCYYYPILLTTWSTEMKKLKIHLVDFLGKTY